MCAALDGSACRPGLKVARAGLGIGAGERRYAMDIGLSPTPGVPAALADAEESAGSNRGSAWAPGVRCTLELVDAAASLSRPNECARRLSAASCTSARLADNAACVLLDNVCGDAWCIFLAAARGDG